MSPPQVSVVIVTWNSGPVIGDCLRSLQATLPPLSWELTVVDNASADNTVEVVRSVAPDARLVVNPTNRGLPAANNQGLRASTGAVYLICNPDVIFEPGAIATLIDVMARRGRAGWVVPRLAYEDGTTQTSVGDLPTLPEALLGRQATRFRRSSSRTTGYWWDDWSYDEECRIGRSHEAAYLVRRQAVDEVGLQDERYVLDWEGFDWTDRFRRAGWETWLAPTATVIHLGGASIRQVQYRWVMSTHRGMYLYFSDRRPKVWKPVLALTIGARALLKMALVGARVPMYQWAHRDRRTTA